MDAIAKVVEWVHSSEINKLLRLIESNAAKIASRLEEIGGIKLRDLPATRRSRLSR
jgi:hypothetical protein